MTWVYARGCHFWLNFWTTWFAKSRVDLNGCLWVDGFLHGLQMDYWIDSYALLVVCCDFNVMVDFNLFNIWPISLILNLNTTRIVWLLVYIFFLDWSELLFWVVKLVKVGWLSNTLFAHRRHQSLVLLNLTQSHLLCLFFFMDLGFLTLV